MMVVSRNPGESLVIGDDVVVTVVQALSGRIRLGVEAPLHMAVRRKEVYDVIWREGPAPGPESGGPDVQRPDRPTTLTLTEAQADQLEGFRRDVSMSVRFELGTEQIVRLLFFALRGNYYHNLRAAVQGQTGSGDIPIPPAPPESDDSR